MTSYLSGILSAFTEPILHGWANVIDNYLSNEIFKRLTTLIFSCQLTNLLFLPIIFILNPPSFLSWHILSIILVIALIEILYPVPILLVAPSCRYFPW